MQIAFRKQPFYLRRKEPINFPVSLYSFSSNKMADSKVEDQKSNTKDQRPKNGITRRGKKETYSSITSSEAVHLLGSSLKLIRWHNTLQNLLGDIPKLLMFSLEQQNDSGALRIERGRNVQNWLLDNLLDLAIGDGGFVAESVDGTTGLEEIDELGGWRHGW